LEKFSLSFNLLQHHKKAFFYLKKGENFYEQKQSAEIVGFSQSMENSTVEISRHPKPISPNPAKFPYTLYHIEKKSFR
jgi:hypothetical protein